MDEVVSPGHTPTDIQSHLYLSFLYGHTADVQLHIKGHYWEAIYHLHRVVLIQAAFFRSLFTAGFLESNLGVNNTNTQDKVSIRFDDQNITRSAFEICIARLYGGGPLLFLSPRLVPTPASPLTPAFHSSPPEQATHTPPDQHPATPRFLLSLLATSIYLCIPSITSQALSMVLNSVGPYTVLRYLSFAIGQHIGSPDPDEPHAAVGLEGVAKSVNHFLEEDLHPEEDLHCSLMQHDNSSDSSDGSCKLGSLNISQNALEEEERVPSSPADSQFVEPSFNYGRIGDKVGEACACWLVRWGADILPHEQAAAAKSGIPVLPRLWARGGLTPHWVRALISSDDFFIKDEWARYDFARRVVDFRRREGIDLHEEREWQVLFQRGIHYSHMVFEDLVRISQDVSPITGQTYVPTEVIHAAHWTQSLLRHRIVTRSPVSGSSSPPPPHDKELGIALSTADILSTISSDRTSDSDRAKPYYPVPTLDTSQRIGDADSAFASANASAEQLFGGVDPPGPGHTPTDQAHFFGILSRRYTAASCIQVDATGKARWTPYAPARFAVEFWGVDSLLEKSRLHSHTIWYAGSLFNVYVQVVRKKGVQLGVYLHRQSSVDPLPRASAPPPLITRADRALRLTGDMPTPLPPASPSYGHARSSSIPVAVPGSPAPPPSFSTPSPVAPTQPYRDPRAVISAHFTISCASATGSSLTRFSSKPDEFSIGQSWGWKSSSLRRMDYAELHQEEILRAPVSRDVSLRAIVVLGLI